MIVGGQYIDDFEYEELFGDRHGGTDHAFEVFKGGPGSGSWESPGNPRFQWSKDPKKEKAKVENDIKKQTQLIWDRSFSGKKVKITCEHEIDYDDSIRITTEMKSDFFKGDAVMMSTVHSKRKEVVHDFYFLDDDKLKKKGFSSSHIEYIEQLALSKGCTKATLQASDQGRWTWPKLGFKCQSRKQLLDLIAFGKSKGIEVKNELDFIKLKKYLQTDKRLKDMDIVMTKKAGVFPPRQKFIGGIVKKGDIEEKEYCPVCGWELESSPAGIWCVNPDCKVLDDADDYAKEKKGHK